VSSFGGALGDCGAATGGGGGRTGAGAPGTTIIDWANAAEAATDPSTITGATNRRTKAQGVMRTM
jgi:hypothetical protein